MCIIIAFIILYYNASKGTSMPLYTFTSVYRQRQYNIYIHTQDFCIVKRIRVMVCTSKYCLLRFRGII